MLHPDGRTRDTGRHPALGIPIPVPDRRQADLAAFLRDTNAGPPEHGPGERRFATLDDAASTLGLDVAREQVARRGIAHAASGRDLLDVAKDMRKAGIEGPVVQEAIRRGLELGRSGATMPPALLAKAASRIPTAASPSGLPRGAAIGSVHEWQGQRVQKQSDGSWKPMAAEAATGKQPDPARPPTPGAPKKAGPRRPGAAEAVAPTRPGVAAPAPGAALGGPPATPVADPSVVQRHRQIAAHAKAHGVTVSGKVKPGHTHDHLDGLERRVNDHLAAKHGTTGGVGPAPSLPPTRPGAMGSPVPLPAPADAPPVVGAPPRGAPGAAATPPGSPVVPGTVPAPPLPASAGPGADVTPAPPGKSKPLGPHEAHAMQQRINELEGQLDAAKPKMTQPYHKQVYNELRADAADVRKRPSPEAEAWLGNRIKAFLAFLTGAAVGVAVAGVAGPAAGVAAGGFATSRMLKSEDEGPRLYVGLGGRVLLADLSKGGPGAGWSQIPGGRHGGFRKPKPGGYDYWYPDQASAGQAAAHHDRAAVERAHTHALAERLAADKALRALPPVDAGYWNLSSAGRDAARPDLAAAYKRYDAATTELNLTMAALRRTTPPARNEAAGRRILREKEIEDGGTSSAPRTASEVARNPSSEKPVEKPAPPKAGLKPGIPAPPPPKPPTGKPGGPKPGASHEKNKHGHTDGLEPGQKLKLRERHAGQGSGEVTVHAGGKFEHDGRMYDGGSALMAAVHGTPQHQTTVRRYFKLGGEVARGKVEKAHSDLVDLLKAGQVLVHRDEDEGIVTLTGELSKAGVPEFMLSHVGATRAVLDVEGAESLATHLRGVRHAR